jgi:hypothetical protein
MVVKLARICIIYAAEALQENVDTRAQIGLLRHGGACNTSNKDSRPIEVHIRKVSLKNHFSQDMRRIA